MAEQTSKPQPLTEAEYLHQLHGEGNHESESIEIDAIQFRAGRQLFLDLAEEARQLSNQECRALLAGVFQIIDGPTYAAMPEEEKQVLEVQQYVLHRRLLNQPRG